MTPGAAEENESVTKVIKVLLPEKDLIDQSTITVSMQDSGILSPIMDRMITFRHAIFR